MKAGPRGPAFMRGVPPPLLWITQETRMDIGAGC